ncbi:hypothetical protein [Derxia lacustris]|uniref:hypothetical protein n=1 Tax=Derxia lacustris TaxID=764842 RepID=UPI000A17260A|nr:hypothetical protein [Derxia lacustris]
MAELLLETLLLKSAIGLRLLDAWSGQPVADGLDCALLRKRDGAVLAPTAVSSGGVQHWPALRWPWNAADAPPDAPAPAPAPQALAEILVTDRLDRFLPLRLDWPPAPDQPGGALASATLLSAPQRLAPVGAASIAGLLTDAAGLPAAWARVLATDAAGRVTEGSADAAGRLALHLPFPRPERVAPASPPLPWAPPTAPVTLRVFHSAAVATEAMQSRGAGTPPGGAPLAALWRAQPEVRALAHIATTDALGPLRLEPGRPAVPRTAGLPLNRSELRLLPP